MLGPEHGSQLADRRPEPPASDTSGSFHRSLFSSRFLVSQQHYIVVGGSWILLCLALQGLSQSCHVEPEVFGLRVTLGGVTEEQVGIGLEVLNGGRVHKAEAEDWWGWGSTEHTHDAGREGHGQLPSYSSKAAGGVATKVGVDILSEGSGHRQGILRAQDHRAWAPGDSMSCLG